MHATQHWTPLAGIFLSLVLCTPSWAESVLKADHARRVYADTGSGAGHVHIHSVGIDLPWAWERPLLGGQLTGHWDAHVAHWSTRQVGAPRRESWTQAALVPTFRLRFNDGHSPWFMEGGIGVSWLDSAYRTARKTFSTRFNFTDHQGFGVTFGPNGAHEFMLILRHVSNAGIKKPNPGEDFVQVRYSVIF